MSNVSDLHGKDLEDWRGKLSTDIDTLNLVGGLIPVVLMIPFYLVTVIWGFGWEALVIIALFVLSLFVYTRRHKRYRLDVDRFYEEALSSYLSSYEILDVDNDYKTRRLIVKTQQFKIVFSFGLRNEFCKIIQYLGSGGSKSAEKSDTYTTYVVRNVVRFRGLVYTDLKPS